MTDYRSAPRLWLVRLGKHGEFEQFALDKSVLRVDFSIRRDISDLKTRDALTEEMARVFPDAKHNTHRNFAAQVNQLVNVAEVGDLVVTPFKSTSTISIGQFKGPYRPGPNGEIERPVEWLRTEIPRDNFRQDLLYSFGAFMTVCEISRNNALDRIKAVLETGRDPGDGQAPSMPNRAVQVEDGAMVGEQVIDLAQIARDQIERRIASVFSGHDFTELVAAILRAQGYQTRVSPPGADQGVDIVAGSGPLGLEAPRVVVQVKSGQQTVDQPTLQGLIGSIHDTHADNGLIVSWDGYTSSVRRRVNELFFRVRLWGRDELVDNLLAHYDKLPESIRADLPLKRTWTIVLDDEEDVG